MVIELKGKIGSHIDLLLGNYPYGRISCEAHFATQRIRNGVAIELEAFPDKLQ